MSKTITDNMIEFNKPLHKVGDVIVIPSNDQNVGFVKYVQAQIVSAYYLKTDDLPLEHPTRQVSSQWIYRVIFDRFQFKDFVSEEVAKTPGSISILEEHIVYNVTSKQ